MQSKTKNDLEFMPLGSGQEVGRSCHILKFKNKTIMLDCGIHPGHDGLQVLPYFDIFDVNDENNEHAVSPADIDLILITHFHLDHVAALPRFLLKYPECRARIFMTHPTLMVSKMLILDYVKVSSNAKKKSSNPLYTKQDVLDCFARCERIDFHQQLEVSGIKFTAYHAGHVLGAAMFLIQIKKHFSDIIKTSSSRAGKFHDFHDLEQIIVKNIFCPIIATIFT